MVVRVIVIVELSKLDWRCFHLVAEVLKDILDQRFRPPFFTLLFSNDIMALKEEL